MKKILILGDAGRGKTTFAEKLSEKLGIPKYSTDDFYWEVKFTKPRGHEEDIKMAQEVFDTRDEWIVEGTTRRMLKLGLDQADIIFYLTYKNFWQQVVTIYKRSKTRENESFKTIIPLILYQFKKKYGLGKHKNIESFEDLLRSYENKVVRLESFEEVDEYLRNL